MGILKVYTDATGNKASKHQGAACIMQYEDAETVLLFSKSLDFPRNDMLSLTTELEAIKIAAKRIRQTIKKYGLKDITHIQFHTDNHGAELSIASAFNLAAANGKNIKSHLIKKTARIMGEEMAKLPFGLDPKISVHHNTRDTGFIPLADRVANITRLSDVSLKGEGLSVDDVDAFIDGEFPNTADLMIDEPDIHPAP